MALAIRVEETLHAQLRIIAQLRETTITDEIRQAIETRIVSARMIPRSLPVPNKLVMSWSEKQRLEVQQLLGFWVSPLSLP